MGNRNDRFWTGRCDEIGVARLGAKSERETNDEEIIVRHEQPGVHLEWELDLEGRLRQFLATEARPT